MVALTLQQKAQCAVWMTQLDSPTAVQRKIRTAYGIRPNHRDMPSRATLRNWLEEYLERGTSERKKRIETKFVLTVDISSNLNYRLAMTEEAVQAVLAYFRDNSNSSTRAAALLVDENNEKVLPPRTIIQRILKVRTVRNPFICKQKLQKFSG